MFHSLDFELVPSHGNGSLKFNTYKDLYLVPTSRPVIAPPSVNTKSIEIPGANGSLDLTESLTPYPTYQNRTGSIEFAVLNDKMHWAHLYSKIMNYLHGRHGKMILEDDKNWYYDGRWAVSDWTSNNDGTWSTVSLEYDLKPYKLSITDSLEDSLDDWLWDPFSFYDGVIYKKLSTNFTNRGLFVDINVDSNSWVPYGVIVHRTTVDPQTEETYVSESYEFNRDITGWMPVSPIVSFSNNYMGIKIVSDEIGYTYEHTYTQPGVYTDPECILYDWVGNGYTVYFKGTGTVTMAFRRGSL